MTNQIKKSKNTSIILDLNKVDFERGIKDGEIWQQDAVYEFNKRLEKTAIQAKGYKNNGQDSPIIHDAIFIGGARGTGKTVFLQNIEGFWQDYVKDKKSHPLIHFCNSIDPTLLVDHDNFANVVIAHLYNEVEEKLETKSCEDSKQDAFYNALRVVSKSLGKQEYLDDGLSGLDRIIQYRSGIQLVKHFNSYINECIKVLEVDTIVLPIDDIDMALERSYEVLDVVRRLLGCPKIIPVITGDLELYEPIIQNRFEMGGNGKIIKSEQAKKLTQEYLKKVIPHHNRVSLEPIERLLPSMKIFDFGDFNKSNEIRHQEYIRDLISCFFGPLNGEEKSCDWPQPDSAREVTQLIRDLSPSELKKENRAELWQRYKVWACLKQDSTAYSNAITAQQIESFRDEKTRDFVTLNKLHAFNPILQLNDLTPKWQSKEFFDEQQEVIDSKNVGKGLLPEQINKHLKKYDKKVIYRSMPALEKFDSNLVIVAGAVNSEFGNSNDNELTKEKKSVLLDTFTFNNYYELTLKTKRQIFFSRAYELLASSLLNFNFNQNVNEGDSRYFFWSKVVRDIYKRAPFYSIPAIFPTKAFNIDLTDSGRLDNQEEELDVNLDKTVTHLAIEITEWETNFKDKLNEYRNDSLMPIIFSVFNKIFTQLRVFRNTIDKSKYSEETLSDLALRFKYITINAFATFLKQGPVVLQNVGFTDKYDTLRVFDSYRKVAPPIRDNVGYFFDFSKVNNSDPFALIQNNLNKENEAEAHLLQAVAKHPVFELLVKPEMSGNFFHLFKKESVFAKTSELAKTSIPELSVKEISQSELFHLKEDLKNRRLNEADHILIFGVNESEISDWSDDKKPKNKELVVNRAKIICELLDISFSARLAQVKFYTNNLKDL